MVSQTVTVSDKYQVVIPKKIREVLKIKRGQKLVVSVPYGNRFPTATIAPEKINWAKYLLGLGKGTWSDEDPQEYINKLRDEWTEREEELYSKSR